MSGIWNRTLVYLGLREEPEEMYDELPDQFDAHDDPHAEHAPARPATSSRRMAGAAVGSGSAEPASSRGARSSRASDDRTERAGRGGDDARARQRGRAGGSRAAAQPEESNVRSLHAGGDAHVRAVPASPFARVAVVEVLAFDDVEAVGARYRTGQPVLFDVNGTDRATGRRTVDFVAGLTFALRGRLTKVGSGAFLLIPDGVELPADERHRLGDLGYRLPRVNDA